jgi:hypothetical protein
MKFKTPNTIRSIRINDIVHLNSDPIKSIDISTFIGIVGGEKNDSHFFL